MRGPVAETGLGWLMTEYGAAMLDGGLRPSRVMAMACPEAIDALGKGRIGAVENQRVDATRGRDELVRRYPMDVRTGRCQLPLR